MKHLIAQSMWPYPMPLQLYYELLEKDKSLFPYFNTFYDFLKNHL